MSQSITEPKRSQGFKALAHLVEALQILDAIEVPANIGANVDLAICQLQDILQAEHKISDE